MPKILELALDIGSPKGDPILSLNLICDNWTLPCLNLKILWVALRECLVGLVRMTGREAQRLEEVAGISQHIMLKAWYVHGRRRRYHDSWKVYNAINQNITIFLKKVLKRRRPLDPYLLNCAVYCTTLTYTVSH